MKCNQGHRKYTDNNTFTFSINQYMESFTYLHITLIQTQHIYKQIYLDTKILYKIATLLTQTYNQCKPKYTKKSKTHQNAQKIHTHKDIQTNTQIDTHTHNPKIEKEKKGIQA